MAVWKAHHHHLNISATTTTLSNKCCLTNKTKFTKILYKIIYQLSWGQDRIRQDKTGGLVGYYLLCLLTWGASIFKRASNCPADILKYKTVILYSSVRRWNSSCLSPLRTWSILSKLPDTFICVVLLLQIFVGAGVKSFTFLFCFFCGKKMICAQGNRSADPAVTRILAVHRSSIPLPLRFISERSPDPPRLLFWMAHERKNHPLRCPCHCFAVMTPSSNHLQKNIKRLK